MIYDKLSNKIKELQGLGVEREILIKECADLLKEELKNLTYSERKKLFLSIERNKKISEILRELNID
jgi:hypothetical protein